MSSHHVIRDKQEPALIIANGEECSAELLGQLLEWSPTIMVLDGAFDRVNALGIKIDILLGDFDRLQNIDEKVALQQPMQVVHTPDQNKTDLEKGIEYLIKEGYPAVNIVWATGLRADHTIGNISSLVKYRTQINLVMWDNYSKIFPINGRFEKNYAAGTPLSIVPMGRAEGVETTGLKYNLHNEDLEMGLRISTLNEPETDGLVTISYRSGHLLMMECHD